MILMLDNYDSFTYNLVQGLAELSGGQVDVVRNDVASPEQLLDRGPRAVVVSPGPGTPDEAGISVELVKAAADVPLLGICLGHQALAAAHGASIHRAPEPVHGKTSHIPTRRSTMGCWATGSRRPKWGSLDQVMIRNRHHHHANDLLKRSSIIVAVKRRGSHPRRCRAHLALVRRLSADRLCGRAACCCISSERRRASEAAM